MIYILYIPQKFFLNQLLFFITLNFLWLIIKFFFFIFYYFLFYSIFYIYVVRVAKAANIIEDDCPERCPCCGRENINPRLKYPYNISIYMDISYTLGFTSI